MQDYTQLTGITVFAIAAAAALWRGGRRWTIIGLIHALMSIEVAMNWRYRIHDIAVAVLAEEGAYRGRAPWQVALLVLLVPLGMVLLARTLKILRDPWLRTAGIATLAMILLFVVQIISLHAIDSLLYTPAGPVLLGAWLWIVEAALVSWCARQGQRG